MDTWWSVQDTGDIYYLWSTTIEGEWVDCQLEEECIVLYFTVQYAGGEAVQAVQYGPCKASPPAYWQD